MSVVGGNETRRERKKERKGMKDEGDERNEGRVRGKRRRIGGDLIAEFPVVMSAVDHPLFSFRLSLSYLFYLHYLST